MPFAAPTPCRHPGCPAVVNVPGYCAKHQRDARQWDNKARARQRQAKRALPTNDRRWRRLRALVLQEQPLCALCAQAGLVKAASVVDHINGDALDNDRSNLQALCASCHARKTAREDGGFGNPKRR
ncbi:MAG: HNH endonuclease [Micavibrio sp.]